MIAALQVIVSSARNHPWLLVLVVLALFGHAADLQWPQYHKFFSTIAYGLFAIAFLYAGGSSLPPTDKPSNPKP